jgi:signal transduction histidine kinase
MERCSRKQPLLPRLSGRDELKEFDDVLHNMNDSLIAVENRKREFVAMINHDLRTPLTALQYVLALALRGKYGQLSDAEIEAVTRQEIELQSMISSINEFLDSEKLNAAAAADRSGDAEVAQ